MAATGMSSSGLHIEECDFEQNNSFGPFQLYQLTAKYKLLAKKKAFSNFKLQKHRRILLCCLR